MSASRPTISRDSHYVPMAMLRRWSTDGTHLYAYRILVSNPKVPAWRRRPIRGVAFHRDLYTVFAGGEELDDFERWLSCAFEQPGLEAVDRLINGSRLTSRDWQSMIRLLAAQDVRTPLSFVDSMTRWSEEIPQTLERSVRETITRLQDAKEKGLHLEPNRKPCEFTALLNVTIERPVDPNSDQALVRAELPVGRRLWVASMRHLLIGASQTLCSHRWSVAEPADDEEWPLTDHPALRLNYYEPEQYDFGGGWGKRGSELMMPVSPRHLLYVQVGKKAANRFTFSREHTRLVQRLLVERAHRWVFATSPVDWAQEVRPRTVDAERLAAEKKAWEEWHEQQMRFEESIPNAQAP